MNTGIAYDTLQYAEITVSEDLLQASEEAGFTYLHCTYRASPKYKAGWWVNIEKMSSLVGGDGEQLPLLTAINIPFAPDKHYLKKLGDTLRFTLIFPIIPKNWYTFDFVEHCHGQGGLSISNIARNNTGVYNVVIS